MDIKRIGWKDVEWVYMPQNREKWRDVVNTVMDHFSARQHRLIHDVVIVVDDDDDDDDDNDAASTLDLLTYSMVQSPF